MELARQRRAVLLLALLLVALTSLPAAMLGLVQITSTLAAQLSGPAYGIDFIAYYSAGRLFLEDPARLYDPWAGEALQQTLRGGKPDVYLQFWNPPHVALLSVPLALLPHGAAYAAWWAFNVVALLAAAWLLAPRRRDFVTWLAAAVLFLPAQLSLVLGQTSLVLVLGAALLSWVLLRPRAAPSRALQSATALALALLPWTFKPQLLPVFVLALALARRWRGLGTAALLGAVLTGLAVARIGLEPLATFAALGAEKSTRVLARDDTAGQTLLGLAQSVVGPGAAAATLALVASAAVLLLVGWMWRGGPRPGPAAYLQLAALPVAAVLAAPHSLAYGLAPWLTSGWLLMRYARDMKGALGDAALGLIALGWATGNLAVLTEWASGLEWGALGGLGLIAGLASLLQATPRQAQNPPELRPEGE